MVVRILWRRMKIEKRWDRSAASRQVSKAGIEMKVLKSLYQVT